MAINLTLNTITTGFNLAKINENFTLINAALQDALSRSAESPNTVLADIDMNSKQLINLGTPTLDAHAATKAYADSTIATSQAAADGAEASAAAALASESLAVSSASAASVSEANASTSETNSATSETNAATSASEAAVSAAEAAAAGGGDLIAANNLSDVASASVSLANLLGLPLAGGTLIGDLNMGAGTQIVVDPGSSSAQSITDSAEPNVKGIFFQGTGGAGLIEFIISSGGRIVIDVSGIRGSLSASPLMTRGGPSATVPSFVPNRSDTDTGIGRSADDQLSGIAGGIEAIRYEEASNQVIVKNSVQAGLTAGVTQTQAGGLILISSYNEVATVGTENDTVVLPTADSGRSITIVNNGANILQIFPAVGDDLGEGVDTAATIEAGSTVTYLAHDATTWNSLTPAAGGGGKLLQTVNFQTGAFASGSTQIPFDNTIPQNTEGDEFMSLAITPTNASSVLKIEVVTFYSTSTGTGNFIMAPLFQDAVVSAIAVGMANTNADKLASMSFNHFMVAGTTSPTTFKVRIGASDTGTVSFNGRIGLGFLGGALASSITISEIEV